MWQNVKTFLKKGLVSRDGQMRYDTLTCIGELAKAIPSKFEAILQRDFTDEMFGGGEELSQSLVSALKSIEQKIPGQTQIHYSLIHALKSVLSGPGDSLVRRNSTSNLF